MARTTTFVPPGSFDAHAHLYRTTDAPQRDARRLEDAPGRVGWQAWRNALRQSMGDAAPDAGLFFAYPSRSLARDEANRFVAEQTVGHPGSRGLLLIHPRDDPAAIETAVAECPFAGVKVYHCYAERDDTFQAECGEFLPEWAWELADRRALAIMLHIVRRRALADPANQAYIAEHCRRYPNARLILAHAARGFCAAHTVEGIAALRGLDHVFFDTSAICEPAAFEAILRQFGPTRLLFGSDFPVSEILGRCVSVGDGFLWLDQETVEWEKSPFAQPIRVGAESLAALQQACRTMRLTDTDVERIFRDNARALLDIDRPRDAGGRDRTDAALYRRAKQRIPGGTQLLSKRPEMYAPDRWPAYCAEARGCQIIDIDGRRLLDMSTSGIGACLLGYADPDVTDAVVRRVQFGSMSTLNAPEELELADLLLAIHPWSDQVRYCRTGGESMAVAVRIARAHTGRDRIAFCGYHGWCDWYLAANHPETADTGSASADRLQGHLLPGLAPAGVPRALCGTALPFTYNRLDQLEQIVARHGQQLAAVVMEPIRRSQPQPGFLQGVRAACDRCGAVLIFDEISSGWRFALGGAHLRLGVQPDMAVFAKALGNGHPIGAVLGRRGVMEAAQTSFISSTYWTESVGPAAAVATIRKMQRCDVPAHVDRIGRHFRRGLTDLAGKHNVPLRVTGPTALLHIALDHDDAAALGTLYTRELLERGMLAGSGFYPSLAHTPQHVDAFLEAADAALAQVATAIRRGDVLQRIDGRVRHTGFARLT